MKTPKSATDIKVGGKTVEEIKKELRNAKHVQCTEIVGDEENGGTSYGTIYGVLIGYVLRDKIFAYIQQLETELDDEKNKNEILIFDNDKLMEEIAQVERERDAIIRNNIPQSCDTCKYARCFSFEPPCNTCNHLYRFNAEVRGDTDNWEYVGVCPENTKEG